MANCRKNFGNTKFPSEQCKRYLSVFFNFYFDAFDVSLSCDRVCLCVRVCVSCATVAIRLLKLFTLYRIHQIPHAANAIHTKFTLAWDLIKSHINIKLSKVDAASAVATEPNQNWFLYHTNVTVKTERWTNRQLNSLIICASKLNWVAIGPWKNKQIPGPPTKREYKQQDRNTTDTHTRARAYQHFARCNLGNARCKTQQNDEIQKSN